MHSFGGKKINEPLTKRALLALTLFLLVGFTSRAAADDCTMLGGSILSGECRIDSAQIIAGTFSLDETLRILGGGSITTTGLTLTISGDLIMEDGSFISGDVTTASATGATIVINTSGDIELQGSGTTGAKITANQSAGTCSGGGGGNITLNAGGDVIAEDGSQVSANTRCLPGEITINAQGDIELKGSGASGAKITANQSEGTNCANNKAGNITLKADSDGNLSGDVTTESGSVITANARCSAGKIEIFGVIIHISGVVESDSQVTGTGATRRPGGGRITVDASCNLTVSVTGKVRSRGLDPGADLVHLEGGCDVQILGLVESTGPGHGEPNTPPNSCNSTFRSDKPSKSTACVEVWAGNSLTIDRTAGNLGEINADTGGSGGAAGTSWIDLFARGPINIKGVSTGTYAVHADGKAGTNDNGGIITVKSRDSTVTTSGNAIRANATNSGGKGGKVTVEGSGTVNFGAASIQARGATGGGGAQGGGLIEARSFNGQILGILPGELHAGGPASGNIGEVRLQGCDTVSYAGSVVPAPHTIVAPACGGAPSFLPLQPYVQLPACLCAAIDLIKKANGEDANTCPGVTVSAGSTVTYTFEVTNTGSVPLVNVEITDDTLSPSLIVTGETLAVGQTKTFTRSGVPAPAPGTQRLNTATVTGEDSGGTQVTDSDPACVNTPPPGQNNPDIELIKKANGDDANTCPGVTVAAGSMVTYTFEIENKGNVTLFDVTVTDDTLSPSPICTISSLAVGATATCTATAPAPAPGTEVRNIATVTGKDDQGTTVSDTDPACVNTPPPGQNNPAIDLVKKANGEDANTCPGVTVAAGSMVTYTFEVTNTGDVTLFEVTVTDDTLSPSPICTIPSLAVGATATCTATAPAPAPGTQRLNTATVVGKDDQGTTVSDTDPACVNTPPPGQNNPAIDLVKKANGDDANTCPGVTVAAGSDVTYTFEVTNTGDVTLFEVTVTDDTLSPNPICTIPSLAVGATETCTRTAPAPAPGTQRLNTATVVGKDDQGTTVSDTDPACVNTPPPGQNNPAIELRKHANGDPADLCPGVTVAAGSTVTYTFEVTNTGDVPLFEVTVTDDTLTPSLICTIPSLAVGATETCTRTAPAPAPGTQRLNTATVVGKDDQGTTVSDTDPACVNTPPEFEVCEPNLTGYLLGDPAPGKLVPFYRVADNLATVVGIENTSGKAGPDAGNDVTVHVTVFTKRSAEVLNLNLCLSPFDFGFVVLQKGLPDATQQQELADRGEKVAFLSADGDFIPPEGYVTFKAIRSWDSADGTCTGSFVSVPDCADEPLATWAVLQDVGSGFFATEIPTPTALVDDTTGKATGGPGAFGLIPDTNRVLVRYDVNPTNGSKTEIFVWLESNAFNAPGDPGSGINRAATIPAFLDCEDELEVSTTLNLPDEVNVIDPATLAGINQCKLTTPPQYRGVLRFTMPDNGFLWSQITQEGQNFRENFLGYNLDCNTFIVNQCVQ